MDPLKAAPCLSQDSCKENRHLHRFERRTLDIRLSRGDIRPYRKYFRLQELKFRRLPDLLPSVDIPKQRKLVVVILLSLLERHGKITPSVSYTLVI